MIKSILALVENRHRIELNPQRMTEIQRFHLTDVSIFYKRLSVSNQKYFEHRVLDFIKTHEFVGREGVLITEKLKTSIAASAIKLTFGYRKYLFKRINTILIYPDSYLSPFGNREHKGETNPQYKVVVLSLKYFEEGNAIHNDNLNLGLHEFTHAMHLSFLSTRNASASYFKRNYRRVLAYLENSNNRKKLIEVGYFRDYAFENQYEFLAVLVEHFFETPDEFQSKLPELYNRVKKLLKIDTEKIFVKC